MIQIRNAEYGLEWKQNTTKNLLINGANNETPTISGISKYKAVDNCMNH